MTFLAEPRLAEPPAEISPGGAPANDPPARRPPTRVLVVVGTRPEAIKLAPVLHTLTARGAAAEARVCLTSQHADLLHPVLDLFGIRADYDLGVMRHAQSLTHITAAVLGGLEGVLSEFSPDWVVVQGDTTTAMAAALAGFYAGAHVAHVEAGLRTYDKWSPMPEEVNRRLVSAVADVHFAPTPRARMNLLREGVRAEDVLVTGNTVVDALRWVVRQPLPDGELPAALIGPVRAGARRLVLVTAHRRENWGAPLRAICGAVRAIAEQHAHTVDVVFPVHPNPQVGAVVGATLRGLPNVYLLPPVGYRALAELMRHAAVVLTDSGGIQEEAPTFARPVLVMRESTERPEAIEAGVALLVGTDAARIEREVGALLADDARLAQFAGRPNPFGDGHAAPRIVDRLLGVPAAGPAVASRAARADAA